MEGQINRYKYFFSFVLLKRFFPTLSLFFFFIFNISHHRFDTITIFGLFFERNIIYNFSRKNSLKYTNNIFFFKSIASSINKPTKQKQKQKQKKTGK